MIGLCFDESASVKASHAGEGAQRNQYAPVQTAQTSIKAEWCLKRENAEGEPTHSSQKNIRGYTSRILYFKSKSTSVTRREETKGSPQGCPSNIQPDVQALRE